MNHREIERWYRLRNLRKASQLLVILFVGFLAIGLVMTILQGREKETTGIVQPPTSGMVINNFTFSAPGEHRWELQAASAQISESLDKVLLTKPKMIYFGVAGDDITLTGDTGSLDKTQSRVSASGEVKIIVRDLQILADEINYSHENLEARSESSVALHGENFQVTGKGFKLSLDKEELSIAEDVKAQLFKVKLVGSNNRFPM